MPLEREEILELQVVQDSQEHLAPLDRLGSRDQQDPVEVQDWRELLDLRDHRELLGH